MLRRLSIAARKGLAMSPNVCRPKPTHRANVTDMQAWLRRKLARLVKEPQRTQATDTPDAPPSLPPKTCPTCCVGFPGRPHEYWVCAGCCVWLHSECYWGRLASMDEWRQFNRQILAGSEDY